MNANIHNQPFANGAAGRSFRGIPMPTAPPPPPPSNSVKASTLSNQHEAAQRGLNVYAKAFLPMQKHHEVSTAMEPSADRAREMTPGAEGDPWNYDQPAPEWMRFCWEEDETMAPTSPAVSSLPDMSRSNSDDEWHSQGGEWHSQASYLAGAPVVHSEHTTTAGHHSFAVHAMSAGPPAQTASSVRAAGTERTQDWERGSMETYHPEMDNDPSKAMIPVDVEEGRKRGGELLSMLSDFSAFGATPKVEQAPKVSKQAPKMQPCAEVQSYAQRGSQGTESININNYGRGTGRIVLPRLPPPPPPPVR
eukprot:gnl/TRDRNA2_/TRDRNA2_69884_c0_seq1.p1 gnl/TRDRNA2_/TRDRNA2_69884_c0~~gnl/TRDRNA2_/TRDRNA2_69884_c0_seq1.p1  ORF type:complete len:306 (+),score=47.82 gnl/TRDRNA2_/TRDRNA2_69884_c0_seq1:58-975(+)